MNCFALRDVNANVTEETFFITPNLKLNKFSIFVSLFGFMCNEPKLHIVPQYEYTP